MTTGADTLTGYCSRVEYYRGEEVAQAMAQKTRPTDKSGKTVWDNVAERVTQLNIDLDDYLDWCFKEAIPGLPYLNTLLPNTNKFIGLGSPTTLRKEVALHVKLLLDRFQRLLQPSPDTPTIFPEDVLFDPRHEFHPVFATEMATSLGISVPEKVEKTAKSINKCMPYYTNEMQTLLKDWTVLQ